MKWITFVMKHKKPGMSLGDAMKEASKQKKHWKKGGGDEGGEVSEALKGGQLMGKGTVAGGRRTRKHKGGQLYNQVGGPYVGGPDNALTDGAAMNSRMPGAEDVQWPGANPSALTGGRKRKHTRKTKKAGRRRGSRKH
jgi:hypothetical protein